MPQCAHDRDRDSCPLCWREAIERMRVRAGRREALRTKRQRLVRRLVPSPRR